MNQVGALSALPEHSAIGSPSFERIARESLRTAGHLQLLFWLQGEFQRSVPHQIFIAAWGDLSSGLLQYDLVSAIPSVRTDNVTHQDLSPLIDGLFSKWVENGTTPVGARFEGGVRLGPEAEEREELKAFQTMQSALVHGIRDARGEQDCLYAFLSTDPVIARSALENLRVLLPFVDAASRRVARLPEQIPEVPQQAARETPTDFGLSGRELEIMDWVRKGKTNLEIGKILDISTFTVKNHLQRIFRRLDVSNRAQAVSKLQQHLESRTAAPTVESIMSRKSLAPGFHPVRRDRLLQEEAPDAYKLRSKLAEPSVCPQCGAVFRAGRWLWDDIPKEAHHDTCPACHRVNDNYPAGYVNLGGAFFASHRDEIKNLVRHEEQRER